MLKIAICTFASAVSATALAAPPSHSIDLTIDPASSACAYSGGGGLSHGDVTFTGRGATTVVVHVGPTGYSIGAIRFPTDPKQQLSYNPPGGTPTSAVIQDKNDAAQTGVYKVTVRAPDGSSIDCDPKIINN